MKPQKKNYPPIFPQPAAAEVTQIADGFYWARFSLPFALDHVNVWLLDGGEDGISIIDSGFNDAPTIAQWEALFAAAPLKGRAVENLFFTHFHPDHFGLAGWLHNKTGARVQMTPGEWRMVQSLTDADNVERLEQLYRPYYNHAGVAEDVLEKLLNRRMGYRSVIHPPPPSIETVHPAQTVILGGHAWRIIGGYGHSPEHASLYCAEEKLFIAGDMVLPFITPNISYFPGNAPGHDPVNLYMETLEAIRAEVPDDVLVLPSHGIPFRGLHERVEDILAHHHHRLDKLSQVLAEGPQTGYAAMQGLFAHRQLKSGDVFFALGETIAHLVYEVRRGNVVEKFEENKIIYQRAS
ncbi:MAG: MBL fold metallo-hydrolase [Alphaproteobacteria bacterium]|nr:MBL fold metallo-hydrolase [Alphaproteobacteria bacterium]